MAQRIAEKLGRLDRQSATILNIFAGAGYEQVAPPIIQPASLFLDVVGEQLRNRTYVFNDPDGEELCLRPDLTVPTCRLHLERHGLKGDVSAKYCYSGPVFRYQPGGGDATHLREFRQEGLEAFSPLDRETTEVEVLTKTLEALKASGLKGSQLRVGDISIFLALLKAIDMPPRWRDRLRQSFWRPEAFRAELKRLTSMPKAALTGLPEDLIARLDPNDPKAAETEVASYLADKALEPIGERSIAEISDSLLTAAVDARTPALPASVADLIERYLAIAAPVRAATARLKDLAREKGLDIGTALDAFIRRNELLTAAGVDLGKAEFSAEFGRNFEYYSGFVFEVVVPSLGPKSPVAGGGRYDGLMKAVGAAGSIAAVGAAVYSDRLALAIEEASKGD
ncbi:MAG TPA: ATP phosphoribosyltransferase regulatory subunit [Hyphomicrobiaceae bacterium]|nr:ATP phosphoribosyltransferase regulatory subunit [Hyphomicrobiaceae bacterium]